jgi:hypothetical protein
MNSIGSTGTASSATGSTKKKKQLRFLLEREDSVASECSNGETMFEIVFPVTASAQQSLEVGSVSSSENSLVDVVERQFAGFVTNNEEASQSQQKRHIQALQHLSQPGQPLLSQGLNASGKLPFYISPLTISTTPVQYTTYPSPRIAARSPQHAGSSYIAQSPRAANISASPRYGRGLMNQPQSPMPLFPNEVYYSNPHMGTMSYPPQPYPHEMIPRSPHSQHMVPVQYTHSYPTSPTHNVLSGIPIPPNVNLVSHINSNTGLNPVPVGYHNIHYAMPHDVSM